MTNGSTTAIKYKEKKKKARWYKLLRKRSKRINPYYLFPTWKLILTSERINAVKIYVDCMFKQYALIIITCIYNRLLLLYTIVNIFL